MPYTVTDIDKLLTKMFAFDLEVWSRHKLVCSFEIVFIVDNSL